MQFTSLNTSEIYEWSLEEWELLSTIKSPFLTGDSYAKAKVLTKLIFPEVSNTTWHSNYLFNSPLPLQIPFTSRMIVDLRPYETPSQFEKHYGIDVTGFTKLVREGYLIPHYGSDFKRYAGKKYLLPIFNSTNRQCSTLRTDRIFELLNAKYWMFAEQIKNEITPALLRIWESSSRGGSLGT
jgi:hypothetical protein